MRLTLTALCLASVALAQSGNPLSSELRQTYTPIKNNLMKMAEKAPEELYGFKASPDIRTFGELVAHVADSAARTCSATSGEAKSANATGKTSKADLVAALKTAFDMCDAAYEGMTDANATSMVKWRNGERSKIGILYYNLVHLNEEYGYMAVYLRVKGIVPPSSEKK